MSRDPWSIGKLMRRRADGSSYWSYCIKWVDDDGPHRVSLGTTDRAAAEAQARNFWSMTIKRSAQTVGELVEAYLSTLPDNRDRKRKETSWKAAQGYWSALRITEIDGQTSRDYVKWRCRAVNTMRNELSLISRALSWARDQMMVTSTPTIHLPAMPESETPHLTKAEFRRLLAAIPTPHVRLFAILAVSTGARPEALLQLQWDQVLWERQIIDLRKRTNRKLDASAPSNKQRGIVPITEGLMKELRAARLAAMTNYVIEYNGRPISSVKTALKAAGLKARLPRITPYMFRHSAAVWMAESRVPIEEISQFLGHKSPTITLKVYARYTPDYLRRAAGALDWSSVQVNSQEEV